MSDIAIRVDHLSKLYHIGARPERHDTLRDAIPSCRSFENARQELVSAVWLPDVPMDCRCSR
jgi:hypothetical protein